MVYRLFVALAMTVFVFPFFAMLSFKAMFPDAHFAFDRQTWLYGLFPIAVGWLIFLAPGLLPGVSNRYYPWVARLTGFAALGAAMRRGFARLRGFVAGCVAVVRSAAARNAKEKPMAFVADGMDGGTGGMESGSGQHLVARSRELLTNAAAAIRNRAGRLGAATSVDGGREMYQCRRRSVPA